MFFLIKNTKIIRMESEDGNGPFNEGTRIFSSKLDSDAVNHSTQFKYQSHSRMDSALYEFKESFTEDHFCAYISLQGFIHFWNDELALIAFLMSGFKIYELTVSECLCSETQAVFLKKDITSKKEISFHEISHFYHQKAA